MCPFAMPRVDLASLSWPNWPQTTTSPRRPLRERERIGSKKQIGQPSERANLSTVAFAGSMFSALQITHKHKQFGEQKDLQSSVWGRTASVAHFCCQSMSSTLTPTPPIESAPVETRKPITVACALSSSDDLSVLNHAVAITTPQVSLSARTRALFIALALATPLARAQDKIMFFNVSKESDGYNAPSSSGAAGLFVAIERACKQRDRECSYRQLLCVFSLECLIVAPPPTKPIHALLVCPPAQLSRLIAAESFGARRRRASALHCQPNAARRHACRRLSRSRRHRSLDLWLCL